MDNRLKSCCWLFGITTLILLTFGVGIPFAGAHPAGADVVLTSPRAIWLGDEGAIDLRLAVDEWVAVRQNGVAGQASVIDLYNDYQVVVEASLQIMGMDFAPTGISLEPVTSESHARFSWRVTAVRPGSASGTVWVHLRLVPKAGGEELRLPLYAFPISIEINHVMGIETRYVRWVLLGTALAALVMLGVEINKQMKAVASV